MTDELKKYLLEQCRDWMLPEEIRALTRSGLTISGEETLRNSARGSDKIEFIYGFKDEKTNKLLELGKAKLQLTIAENLIKRNRKELLNYCQKCKGLARTPRAKQCRHCGYDWH